MPQAPSGSPSSKLITNRLLHWCMYIFLQPSLYPFCLWLLQWQGDPSCGCGLKGKPTARSQGPARMLTLLSTGNRIISRLFLPFMSKFQLGKLPLIAGWSWGYIAANLLGYIRSQCELKKRIHCSRPNSFKANNPPESVWKCWNCQCQLTPCIVSVKLQ